MPGGFTHFAIVKSLNIHSKLMSIEGMSEEIALDLMDAYSYVELGAVSPDLPYLVPLSRNAEDWGNTLHHDRTVESVRTGVRLLPTLAAGRTERKRAMAWLFGYASHTIADMISHPVVTFKIGPYETHKTQHRVCELNQDTYIFKKYFDDTITHCEYLDRGIRTCTKTGRTGSKLAPFLNEYWRKILQEVYPEKRLPNPADWFRKFASLIDNVAEEGNRFAFLLKGLLENNGYTYPDEPDMTYINDLLSPYGRRISFDELFFRFLEETKIVWGQMAQAVIQNNPDLITLKSGDLDTGLDLADNETSVFWSGDERGIV